MRAGAGAGLHQRAEIGVALRYHARERRRDLGVVEQRLIVFPLGFRSRQHAFGGLQIRLGSFHLRRHGKSPALGIVHFLLRHQARLGLRDAIEPVKLQLQHFLLGFHTVQLILGMRNLGRGVLHRRVVLLHLQL